VLSHRHFDHISGFRLHVEIKLAVTAYLPADDLLWAPRSLTFFHDSKEIHWPVVRPKQIYSAAAATETTNPIDLQTRSTVCRRD